MKFFVPCFVSSLLSAVEHTDLIFSTFLEEVLSVGVSKIRKGLKKSYRILKIKKLDQGSGDQRQVFFLKTDPSADSVYKSQCPFVVCLSLQCNFLMERAGPGKMYNLTPNGCVKLCGITSKINAVFMLFLF